MEIKSQTDHIALEGIKAKNGVSSLAAGGQDVEGGRGSSEQGLLVVGNHWGKQRGHAVPQRELPLPDWGINYFLSPPC